MSLLETRSYFKPFQYNWAFEAYNKQQQIHWLPDEVPLGSDISDWNTGKLSNSEKNLLTQLFRFFTQADVSIAEGYIDKYLPIFRPPEVRMMLTAFANMESIHMHAYSRLLDSVGMPEVEYSKFQEYEDMKAKHDYLDTIKPSSLEEIAETLAIYSAFGEGLQLFSSFAILLNFSRFNKMKGMSQIVTYSVRDETLHVDSMIKLFHIFLDENPKIWKSNLKKKIYLACQDMVLLEDKFIDLAFEQGGIEGLDKEGVKTYIRFIADRRCLQLGLKPVYKQKKNPLGWLDNILNAVELANFFETTSSEYSSGALTGSWEELKW
jgi:ribonucleoside-diphosphate reductase beta chain